MQSTRNRPKNALERELIRQELLLDWQSSSTKDAALSDQEIEDWLAKLQDCLQVSCAKSHS